MVSDGKRLLRANHFVDGKLVVAVERAWERTGGGWTLASTVIALYEDGQIKARVIASAGDLRLARASLRSHFGDGVESATFSALALFSPTPAYAVACGRELAIAVGAALIAADVCAGTAGLGCPGALILYGVALDDYHTCLTLG